MNNFELKVGDRINGYEITEISKCPFVLGQINIFVNAYETNWQGDMSQIIFRILPKEQEIKNIELSKKENKNGNGN